MLDRQHGSFGLHLYVSQKFYFTQVLIIKDVKKEFSITKKYSLKYSENEGSETLCFSIKETKHNKKINVIL